MYIYTHTHTHTHTPFAVYETSFFKKSVVTVQFSCVCVYVRVYTGCWKVHLTVQATINFKLLAKFLYLLTIRNVQCVFFLHWHFV